MQKEATPHIMGNTLLKPVNEEHYGCWKFMGLIKTKEMEV